MRAGPLCRALQPPFKAAIIATLAAAGSKQCLFGVRTTAGTTHCKACTQSARAQAQAAVQGPCAGTSGAQEGSPAPGLPSAFLAPS